MASLQLEEKLLCAICLDLYQEAVTLPCGHNFCRACIEDHWGRQELDCPQCRAPFTQRPALSKNGTLCEVVEAFRASAGPPAAAQPAPGPSPGARCARHERPLEFFCRTERRCVCCACAVDRCRGHVCVLPEAEREELEKRLKEQLKENRIQAIQAEEQLQELQQKSDKIQKSADTLTLAVSNKVNRLLQALEAYRNKALVSIEQAQVTVLTQVKETKKSLQDHLQRLEQNTQQIEELLACPSDMNFLQGSLLLITPGALTPLPSLKWDEDAHQLSELKKTLVQLSQLLLRDEICPVNPGDAGPGLEEHGGSLEPTPGPMCELRKRLKQNYRNLTFDPDTANHHLYLSLQNQRVKHRSRCQLTARPGSFQLWQVLCAQGFETGKHYWEVEVSSHSVTLGVTYPGLDRKNLPGQTDNIGRNPCSWGLRVQEDGYQAWHNGNSQRLLGTPGHLLGMELDMHVGYLSFYSLEPKIQRLHVFNAIFTQPLYPVFWLCEGRTITLCHQLGAKPFSGAQEEALIPS